jgi:agmatine deiminase
VTSILSCELASKNLLRFPAEWEKHEATWIAWPTNESDWPGKFEPIKWVYAEIVRVLVESERVEIICQDKAQTEEVKSCLTAHGVNLSQIRLHVQPTNRSWLRDSAPTGVYYQNKPAWAQWKFNAWAKYDDYEFDSDVPALVSKESKLPLLKATLPGSDTPFVCEGGAIDSNGEGTLLVTEECLLSEIQCRNPGLSRREYSQVFAQTLGVEKIIWLKAGIAGDDTHGHIDDVARFVAPRTVMLAYEDDIKSDNHSASKENLSILSLASDARGNSLQVILLPMPKPVYFEGQRLPASYANFYIANDVVLVPTFNDPRDRLALNLLAQVFPRRSIVGIHSTDLVLGLGTLHCLTQQQPADLGE